MKLVTIAVALAALSVPATADAWTHRLTVPPHSVASWNTPQRFSWTDPTVFKIGAGGHVLDATYKYERRRRCAIGWSAREAAVETQMPCRGRSPVTIEVANMRETRLRVRVTYWNPRDPTR